MLSLSFRSSHFKTAVSNLSMMVVTTRLLAQGHIVFLEGPAASSLVVHRLSLNPVNPLNHGLLFERFLDPDQTFAPMRQLSISEGGQEEVVRYARKKYGWDGTDDSSPWRAYSQPWQSPGGGTADRATIDVMVHPGLSVLKRTLAQILERNGRGAVVSRSLRPWNPISAFAANDGC